MKKKYYFTKRKQQQQRKQQNPLDTQVLSQLVLLGTKTTRRLPPRQHMCPWGQRQDGRGSLLAKPSPLEEKKKNLGKNGVMVWFRWQMGCADTVWGRSRLQWQFSCSLCVTAGVHVWNVTPTTSYVFLPPAGLPFSSAGLSWCQCHCLRLLPHWGKGKCSHWPPKTAKTFLAAVLDLWLWELPLLSHQLGSGSSASSQPTCPEEMSWRAQKCEETHRSYSARVC